MHQEFTKVDSYIEKTSKNQSMKTSSHAETVTNPRDFLHTNVPQLADLDSLLRCHICKDFLSASVLTPCGHSFCSICIRKYLQKESKCPLCLSELTESMLQKEFLVQEICSSYVKLRDSLLQHLTKPFNDDRRNNEIKMTDDYIEVTKERRRTPDSPSLVGASAKKRKHDGITSLLMKKKTDHRHREEKTAQCPICSKYLPLSELEASHIDQCLLSSNTLERSDSFEILDERTPSLSAETQDQPMADVDTQSSSAVLKADEQKGVTFHNERYLNSGLQQRKEVRLPRLDLQSLSAAQLKQKLAYLGIPSNGNKQQMVARYKHYEMLWNSNFFDSIDPVDEIELKRRLSSWELKNNADHSSDGNSITNLLRGNKRSSLTASMIKLFNTDRFDRNAWVKHHSSAFKELKLEAMASHKQAKLKKENLSQSSIVEAEPNPETIPTDTKDTETNQ
ncbi:unnamed protein product [Kluyveromyces dobzhanskii CBS 2104]|uniref:Postreplication repair E3 ubiquitin-protein ligase RAD18 n=1 Tax=Kluyveromyces dobzhanskii CBS 2104 TaxID=1427455 RepID=A0A0A8L2J8_9SACH|nr:unnamed protein product [Kluyveromyces dobzhanskii CBS 2104]